MGDFFEAAWDKTKNITIEVGETFAAVVVLTWEAVKYTTVNVVDWLQDEWNEMEQDAKEKIVDSAVWI